MFLDFADDQAKHRQSMYMKDWEERLDAFLKFNDRIVLTHAGKISHEKAEDLAFEHYQKFDDARMKAESIAAEKEAIDELKVLEEEIKKAV